MTQTHDPEIYNDRFAKMAKREERTRESPERVVIHSLTRMAELNGMAAEIVSTDGDTCVCRIATPGHECTNQLVKVCG